MDLESKLQALKIDLGITTDAYDERLAEYLEAAAAAITREGVTLEDTGEDAMLVIIYAAWLWRKRDNGDGMPRMLRWQLNNRLFSEKIQGAE